MRVSYHPTIFSALLGFSALREPSFVSAGMPDGVGSPNAMSGGAAIGGIGSVSVPGNAHGIEHGNGREKTTYVEGIPDNAPVDANKDLSAMVAAQGQHGQGGPVDLEEAKQLLQMGIDELVVTEEEVVETGGAGYDYSMDGGASHKEEVNVEPIPVGGAGSGGGEGAGYYNPYDPMLQGDPMDTSSNYTEVAPGDDYGEDMYEMEAGDLLEPFNETEFLLQQQLEAAANEVEIEVVINETENVVEEDYLFNDTEATSRRRQRNLRYPKNVPLPKLTEEQKRRKLQNLATADIGTFAPLSCNDPGLPTAAECESSPAGTLSSLVSAANGGEVIVPCGGCYVYDLPAGETTIGGLNIIGKLYVPPNHKSTLLTPYVFVQGELEMSDTNLIAPENVSLRIVLTGTTDVMFAPADSNAGVAGTPFNAGTKAFLVAGGKLNVRGWDESDVEGTATWSPLLAMAEGARPTPDLSSNLEKSVRMTDALKSSGEVCSRQVVNHNFDEEVDHSVWSAGEGAIVSHDDVAGTMVVTNINKSWQGPRLDFTKYALECPLIEGAKYLITLRIKVDKEGFEGQTTPCGETNDWRECLKLTRKIMLSDQNDRYSSQRVNKGIVGKYGEWFTFTSTWTYEADDLVDTVMGNLFYLEYTEPGTTISIDDFVFELPSERSYPVANDACQELVVNGDAENSDGAGWSYFPMWSSRSNDWQPNIHVETLPNGSVNKFFRASNRRWHSDTIRASLLKECFVKGLVYNISLKVRIQKDVPLKYYVQLKGPRADGSGWTHKQPLMCPEQTQDQGWVECSGPLLIDEEYEAIGQDLELEVIMDSNQDTSPWAVVDYDDISISFASGPAEGLKVDGGITSRWGPNAEVHITSSTLSNRDSQNAIIESIVAQADGSATLKLQTGIDAVISEKEEPGQGVEVILVSRNIVVEGEASDNPQLGGYFQVFHTPGVAQTIEGVEFVNMGQEQGKNRFALQFLYTGDVPGTSISRNSIHHSNHRCIVIEGTSNATISSNVGYETAGHCFWFGHESVDNLVIKNIGSRTNDNINWRERISGHNDHQMATYQIYSPLNDYIANVAAGSDGRGFRMYNDWRTLGEDLVNTEKGSLRRVAMRTFKDNKSHSNSWQGFSLYDFEQFFTFRDDINVPVFENLMAYRNQNHGIHANNVGSAEFRGGVIQDNQWGIYIERSDGILIENMQIKGYTDLIKDITIPSNRLKLCRTQDWRHEGLTMMNTRWRYGEHDNGNGLRMNNVTFSDFDKNTDGCVSSWPIAMMDHKKYDTHFDYVSSWENVEIVDSRGYMFDGCGASQRWGFDDIVINDLDGSLDPTDGSAGPSALVSNFPHMTKIFGDKCTAYADNCMAYCTDVCLRTFYYNVEQFETENWKLVVTNANGDKMEVSGIIEASDNYQFTDAWKYMKFPVSLPAGTYTAEFIDENGNQVWPMFIEEKWENPPDCSGYASPSDITILKPEVSGPSCDELVRNGGQDASISTSDPWLHTHPGVEVGVGLGLDGSDAIKTINRKYHWTGLGQNIDTRCIKLMEGQYFEFSAWIKMLDSSGNPANVVDPNREWYRNMSPILTINAREYRDALTKQFIYTTEDRDKAWLARPYKPDGWNLVHGLFRLPENSPRVFWELERAPDNIEFIVDNASIKPVTCNPDMLLKNGNLEDADVSKYWDTWGGEVGLDIVTGYGGSGNALKAFKRSHLSHGPAQIIDMDCVNAGDRLAFKAKIKFESSGATAVCNPYTWGSDRCSDFFMYTYTQGTRHYRRVAWIASDDPVDGWFEIAGVYTLNEDQANAEFAKVYFDGAVSNLDVIVDDVEVKKIPQTCEELTLNPSFEESTAFWSFIDRGYSKVGLYSPGAGGESDFALRSYDRGSSEWRGIRQQLDNRCFVVGAEYKISAKFRLLNPSTGEGETCDTNVQYNSGERTQCPSVVVYGWQCEGDDVYWRFWNQIPGFDWDKDSFNDFENSFTVTDQLASCNTIHVYVHQVNRNWDIVMDDMKISAAGTDAPTYAPTLFPTETGVITTPKPTVPPTSMPTVATVTDCPGDTTGPIEVAAGPIMLAKSNLLCILTKAVVDADGAMSSIAPVARSYDGQAWEKSAGEFATMLLYGQEFGDYTSGSQITLPELDGGSKYFLTSYSYSLSDENTIARMLETATFGTTLSDLENWVQGTTFVDWVDDQIKKPITSHREFFRQRVNPRFAHSLPIGRSDHPCKGQSRWRKFTFAKTDGELGWKEQWFEAKFNDGDKYITIKLNGHVRTVVESIAFKNPEYILEFNKKYKMRRRPREYVDGDFYLYMDDGSYQSLVNPPVTFYTDSIQPPQVLNLPALTETGIDSIDEYRSNGGEFILHDELSDPLCSTLNEVSEDDDTPVFGKLPDGSWLVYDPRLKLEENTPISHPDDGGGMIQSLTGGDSRCVNAPRTFLNEEQCTLSFSPIACGSSGTPDVEIELNANNIALLHTITGQYIYGVLGLPVVDHEDTSLESPCTVGLRSRWEIKDATECTQTNLGTETNATLVDLLTKSSDTNPFVRDIIFPTRGYSCSADDTTALDDVELVIGGICYKRVHPDHMSVYDFTYWTLEDTHPGNMVAAMEGEYNPIKKWMDLDKNVFLTYPSFPSGDVPNHSAGRWDTHSTKFPMLGRFGDTVLFVDLPNEIRLDEVAQHFGETSSVGGSGVVVCGSPFEAPNDPSEGYQFDMTTRRNIDLWGLGSQREHLWVMVGLTSEDQLRQRVAWALSQLLVVVPGAVSIADSHTEAFLTYYDIFVRNAFGNYGDVLREISYSPLMAENLSFLQSKSAAYMWETQGKISFADENFAREIMQLFSTGLYLLNLDGTQKLDDSGQPIPVYSNDEIMSFSRVWTGFDYQQARGNVEETSWSGNRHDPMRIQSAWRDKFPKTDLTGGYIGDGYPLCVDLPDKMFLRKGARYRLLGSSSSPELIEDHSYFKKDPNIKRFVLDSNSGLKARLCNASNGECQYEMSVILDANIDCVGNECIADTVRVVDVGGGIYYEYVRPPCVEQAFYNNAMKVIYRERWADSSCANPLLPYASEACCSVADLRAQRYPNYLYDQERVLFSTANSRCEEIGMTSCDFNDIGGIETHQKGYHWSTDHCQILLKVNAVGQVAIVYEPEDYAYLHPHIRDDNRNFFKVYWRGDYPKNDNDVTMGNNCGGGICEALVTGGCLCDTVISETLVFNRMPANKEEVLANLNIGAYDPSAFDEGTYTEQEANGVKAYFTSFGIFDRDTVFEVTDEFGRILRFKNTKENVRIKGAPEYSFRNAPSFMSLLNTEASVRDAEYETEAALDHYLHHDNTAPFIAIRLIQRFTTSNPSPRYVKEVATAFRNGKYGQFGTGAYGDLAATIAAVLLEPEARSVTLDADPFRGGLREPILRVMAVLRSMEVEKSEGHPVLRLEGMSDKIGQMAHSFPTVFSFFLPEYRPDGRPGEATLVGPETMIMDMPKIVGMLNGLFSLVKYGLSDCDGGFGSGRGCTEGDFSSSAGHLTLSMPYTEVSDDDQAEAVVNKLSTLLTSGRLSDLNKEIIKKAYKEMLPDVDAALRMAQQLLLTSPEFHSTNIVKMSGESRAEPELPQPSGSPYKAIVYVMFGGGCDSYNMLVPHTCTGIKDMYAEYQQVREEIALPKSSLLEIDASTSNQICDSFGLHPKLQAVQGMYNDGDLLFFTNTGVLTKETDKENWRRDTVTQLFAHNWMQREAERVDPLKEADGTGILGRIADALNKKGRSVGTFSIERNTISLIGTPGLTSTPFILSRSGVSKFNNRASSESMEADIAAINNATAPESGVFGDYWSETLVKSLSHNKLLYDTLSDKQTDITFPTSYLGRQLEMVAKMIDSRAERGSDADMFFLSTGGWDTHSNVLDNMDRLFEDVDNSFKAFADEMKAKGVWDGVTVIETSDFARTLAPNTGRGSDHAWGGNYMMFGGGVKGGQIVGTYPDNLTDDGPRSLGRGRMIPTTSWDAVFVPLAEWAGATPDDLPNVCPNKDNFPASHFIDATALFEI